MRQTLSLPPDWFCWTMPYCMKNYWVFITLVLLIFVYVILAIFLSSKDRVTVDSKDLITYFADVHLPSKPVKKILIWTTYFLRPYKPSVLKGFLSGCKFKCEVTNDKREIENADAVEFHLVDTWRHFRSIGSRFIIDLPKTRTPGQVWILYNMEPPSQLFGDLSVLNGLFNWTRWYRTDSDVPNPYFRKVKLTEDETKSVEDKLKIRNFFKEKTKDAFLRISNCFDHGYRYKIIDEMQSVINIDKFGRCYGMKCDKKSCSDSVLKRYKFHIAFENDVCQDYVTEKYWETLARDQVPIVNWKNVNDDSLMPNSYININNFPDINEAANFILKVGRNETLYNSYFSYRKYYKHQKSINNLCGVCEALHSSSKLGQVYTDLESWVRNDTCQTVGYLNRLSALVNGFAYYWLGIHL